MNCFPCKGPACNSCKKFDRIIEKANEDSDVRCPRCGGKVGLSSGLCLVCGKAVIPAPGCSRSR